jgi:hypothetical protein
LRTLCFGLIAFISANALGQSTAGPFFVKNEVGRVGVETSLRADPPSSPLGRIFAASSRGRSITNGPTFYSRILLDKANHAYLGYELLIEQQQQGKYLATFGKLGVTPLDLAAGSIQTRPQSAVDVQSSINLEWKMLSLPAIPEPRIIHDGDTISIELFVDVATGDKLIEDIRINPPRSGSSFVPPVPTVSGTARDFSAADAELQIIQARVTLNRALQVSSGLALRNVHGTLVWLYLPDHGRYVLSLVPRAGLGFKKAGEVRGGVITFTLDNDSIKLECMSAIANGDDPYNLYILHDKDWEPTAEKLKDLPAVGTVGAAELAVLKRN